RVADALLEVQDRVGLFGRGIPDLDDTVSAGGRQSVLATNEGNTINPMPCEDRLAGTVRVTVPNANHVVYAAARQSASGRMKGHDINITFVTAKRAEALARMGIPQPDCAIR